MEKIYRVQMNSSGMPNFATAEEIPQGEWVEKEVIEDTVINEWQSARCSECGKYHTTPYMYYFDSFNFCPNCGSDNREREGE